MNTESTSKASLTLRFDWYRLIFTAVVIFTIFTRFYGLERRPYDHDESLYATCSWYLYEGRGYQYDPLMHGPFSYYFNALLFNLFGPGDYVARAPSALFGLALVCCTVLFRRRLGKTGSLIAATLFAVSPTFMYFSRLFREDIFVAFWAFLTVALFLNYLDTQKRGYLFGSAASFALVFCVKENSYSFLFIFASFWAFMKVFERFSPPDRKFPSPEPGSIQRLQWADTGIAIAIFFSIFFLFFTSFFSNPGGFLDGLYRKSLGYWMHQDKIQRMKGAFTYFCPLAIVYELPLLVILFSGVVGLLKQRRLSKIVLIAGSVTAIPLMLFWHRGLPTEPWDTRFHMTSTLHVVFALYIFALLFTAVCNYLKVGRRFPAFLAYWSLMSVLIYSYAGEKVPWLLMHILMPIVLWASLMLGEFLGSERFRRNANLYSVLLGIGLLLFIKASLQLCFVNEADPAERMVSQQTSTDIKSPLREIAVLAERTGMGRNLPIAVQGDCVWPFAWYLRDYKDWFSPGPINDTKEAVVILDWDKRRDYSNILEPNYVEKRYRLRIWWGADPVSSLKSPIPAWLRYYFFREPWNPKGRKVWWTDKPDPTGSQDIAFYVRKDLVGGKMEAPPTSGAEDAAAVAKPATSEKYEIIGHIEPALVFGERGSSPGRLDEPRGIWVDEDKAIYVADTKNHRWQKFDRKGKCVLTVGTQGNKPAQFKEPMGIAVDEEGKVYVADTWNHRIQKFDRKGAFVKQWQGGEGGFWAPKGMAFDGKGYLYVVDTGKHRVQKFTRDGEFVGVWGSKGEGDGQFSEPVGIAVDTGGKRRRKVKGGVVYVADTANRRLQKFDTSGKFLGEFGVLGWEEYFTEPFIALDPKGRLWITDSRNNRVEIFDSPGKLLALWSARGFGPGDFNAPIGIYVRDDRVYLTDTYNHRIQVFDRRRIR
jgi:uncharacterized protein (TIGR03663 family)